MMHGRTEYHSLDGALTDRFGPQARVLRRSRIAGGDINEAYRLTLSTGETVFCKTNDLRNAPFFRTEARGLDALRATGTVGVPRCLGMGVDARGGYAFLLLEYLDAAPRRRDYWETFGRSLAALHRAPCDALLPEGRRAWGFPEDNFIGASPQANGWREDWVDFYRTQRLLPQAARAARFLDGALRRRMDRLLDHLDEYLREPPFPSLLHGDLWSGNVLCGPDGAAWIVDPAAYLGDFEADLAMTELFGRFPAPFYAAYREVNPVDGGYRRRLPLYHLYHLLNHLNLFGAGYLSGVAEILRAL